jgi:hypothetical protein
VRSSILLGTTAFAALALYIASPAVAGGDLDVSYSVPPAVSGTNSKFDFTGGGFDHNATGLFGASISSPLSHSYGLQIDGLIGGTDDGGIYGGAAHLFWRNPNKGLVGVYSSVTHVENVSQGDYTHYTVAFEGQAYSGRMSFESIVGYEGGDNVEKGLFTISNVAYYPSDNMRLYAGIRYIQEDLYGAGGVELQLQPSSFASGMSLFGEGRVHDDDSWQAWAGVRFHFGGGSKSLIRRHREDDPANVNKEFLFEPQGDSRPSCGPGSVPPTPCEEPE